MLLGFMTFSPGFLEVYHLFIDGHKYYFTITPKAHFWLASGVTLISIFAANSYNL